MRVGVVQTGEFLYTCSGTSFTGRRVIDSGASIQSREPSCGKSRPPIPDLRFGRRRVASDQGGFPLWRSRSSLRAGGEGPRDVPRRPLRCETGGLQSGFVRACSRFGSGRPLGRSPPEASREAGGRWAGSGCSGRSVLRCRRKAPHGGAPSCTSSATGRRPSGIPAATGSFLAGALLLEGCDESARLCPESRGGKGGRAPHRCRDERATH